MCYLLPAICYMLSAIRYLLYDIEDAYGDGPPPPTFEFPTIVAALKHCGSFWSFWCFCIFCSFWCFCISWISALFE